MSAPVIVGSLMVGLSMLCCWQCIKWVEHAQASARQAWHHARMWRQLCEAGHQPRDASGRFAKAPKPTVVKALAMREQFGMSEWKA